VFKGKCVCDYLRLITSNNKVGW